MKVIVTKDYEEASQKAAEIMLDVIKNKPTEQATKISNHSTLMNIMV